MTFGQVAYLAGAYFDESVETGHRDEFVVHAVEALQHLDSHLGDWLRGDSQSLQSALDQFARYQGENVDLPWLVELDLSITPLIVLLVCWAIHAGGPLRALRTLGDLLEEMMGRWRARETQRLSDQRFGHPQLQVTILERIVHSLGHRIIEEQLTWISLATVEQHITESRISGFEGVSPLLWCERLSECGLFFADNDRGIRFIHGVVADYACARYLEVTGTPPGLPQGALAAWTRFSAAALEEPPYTTSQVHPDLYVRDGPFPPVAQRWLAITRLLLELALRRDRSATELLLDDVVGSIHPGLSVESDDGRESLVQGVLWLAAELGIAGDATAALARDELSPPISAAESVQRLRASIPIEERTVDRYQKAAMKNPRADDYDPPSLDDVVSGRAELNLFGTIIGAQLSGALLRMTRSRLEDAIDEAANGPSVEQAYERAVSPGAYPMRASHLAARVIIQNGNEDEDPYVIAAVIRHVGSLHGDPKELTGLLARGGWWGELATHKLNTRAIATLSFPYLPPSWTMMRIQNVSS